MRRKPRGAIPLDTIPYTGERALEGAYFSYVVSGMGQFPQDMLRYDEARVSDPEQLDASRRRRDIPIAYARQVTPGRWQSFGWTVQPGVIESAEVLA